MDFGDNDPERLFFCPQPGKLLDLALVAVSSQILRLKKLAEPRSSNLIFYKTLKLPESRLNDEDMRNICSERVPDAVKHLISEHLDVMTYYWYDWCKYHRRKDIFRSTANGRLSRRIGLLDGVVWHPDGKIDYDRTARKLLSSVELTHWESFAMAATYCFEREAVFYRSRLTTTEREFLRSDDCKNEVLVYWKRFSYHGVTFYDEDIEKRIFLGRNLDNWSSIEYFWDLIEEEDRLEVFLAFYTDNHVTRLLPILNNLYIEELEDWLLERGSDVIAKLVDAFDGSEYALKIWYAFRNMMSSDMFLDMLRKIHNVEDLYGTSYVHLHAEIWRTAPESLKMSLRRGDVNIEDIFTPYGFPKDLRNLSRNVQYFLDILPYFTSASRNQYWKHNWIRLVYGTSSENIARLMKICFANEHDIVLFKENQMCKYELIENYCDTLIQEGYIGELNEFLQFCCSSQPHRVAELKRKILKPSLYLGCEVVVDPLFLSSFDGFLQDVFTDENESKRYRDRVVLRSFVKYVYPELFSVVRPSPAMSNLLSDIDNLEKFKKDIVRQCKREINNGNLDEFEGDKFRGFLLWCVNDNENAVRKFKKFIPLNRIFAKCLEKHLRIMKPEFCYVESKYDPVEDLRRHVLLFQKKIKKLESFLLWYFETEQAVDEFKLKTINAFHRIKSLWMTLQMENRPLVDSILLWFFNKNFDRVEEFKGNLKR